MNAVHPKVTGGAAGGGAAGYLTLILLWALHQYAHVEPPPEVAGAIGGLVVLVVGTATAFLVPGPDSASVLGPEMAALRDELITAIMATVGPPAPTPVLEGPPPAPVTAPVAPHVFEPPPPPV